MKKKLKELSKNKNAVGISCIGFAIVLTVLNISMKSSSQNLEETTAIVTTTNISAGDKILESMVQEIKLQGEIPENIITSKEEVVGKYAKTNLMQNDIFIEEKLSVDTIYGSAYLENLGKNQRAISMTLRSLAIGLSGKLESGDIVSIVSVNENGEANIYEELKYIELINVSDSNGYDVNSSNGKSDKSVGATATFLVNEEQAKFLANLELNGNIHLVLVYRGNDEYKKQLLDEQQSFFVSNEEVLEENENVQKEIEEEKNEV